VHPLLPEQRAPRRRVARERARCVRLDLQAGLSKTRARRVRKGSLGGPRSLGERSAEACL
jgi:hypothetical protein